MKMFHAWHKLEYKESQKKMKKKDKVSAKKNLNKLKTK